MAGLPVTIRLLDPPLHEFLPHQESEFAEVAEAAGVAAISLFDVNAAAAEALAGRLREHYPALQVHTGSNDPTGHALVVNATPMGMNEGDPLPMDVSRIAPGTFVGEVVMRTEMTAFLNAALPPKMRFLD